jgi:hypothetical protein
MFALFEAGLQRNTLDLNPRLRRCAPHLGLTKFNLSEVVSQNQSENHKNLFFFAEMRPVLFKNH